MLVVKDGAHSDTHREELTVLRMSLPQELVSSYAFHGHHLMTPFYHGSLFELNLTEAYSLDHFGLFNETALHLIHQSSADELLLSSLLIHGCLGLAKPTMLNK